MTGVRSRLGIPAVIAAAGMFIAGCGAGGDAAASAVATDQVDMPPSYRFAPVAIQVQAGTSVTWTNSDNFTHSVLFDGESEPIALLKPGETASRTFETAGTFPYVCSLHPQDMTGVVEVTAS